jgi:hypothetical protein
MQPAAGFDEFVPEEYFRKAGGHGSGGQLRAHSLRDSQAIK